MRRVRLYPLLLTLVGSLTPLLPAWAFRERSGDRAERLAPESRTEPSPLPAHRPLRETRARHAASVFGLSGLVLDPFGDPISDAEVWLETMNDDEERSPRAPSARWLGTNAAGRFTAPSVPAGLYTLTAVARGFRPRAIAVELDAETADLRVELAPAPSPEAVVVDLEGRAVSDAIVVACAERSEVTLHSASDGTVAFGPAAIGCSAVAHHPRFARSATVRLRDNGRTLLRLERGGSIEGVVTDHSGRALFGCDLAITSYEPSDAEGPLGGSMPELRAAVGRDFRLTGLAPGSYKLSLFRRASDDTSAPDELASTTLEVLSGRAVRGVHLRSEPPIETE